MTSMMTNKEDLHTRHIDAEDLHERDDVDISALIRNIEAEEEKSRGVEVKASGTPSSPAGRSDIRSTHLKRLTECKNKAGYVSSVLAWDDLTHMKLDRAKSRRLGARRWSM